MRKIVLLSWMLLLLLVCSCSSNQAERSGSMFDPSVTGQVNYDQPPQIMGVISPDYPMIARKHRVQGVVVLEVKVYKSGEVGNIKVKKSIPPLDQAAINAVEGVRFKPALQNGKAVDASVVIPIEFRLN